MPKLTDERKALYRALHKRRALLALAIRHPDKLDDEKAVTTVVELATKVADARIALKELDA